MKSNYIIPNPYVFPFTEFKNLANKKFQQSIKKQSVTFDEIEEIINIYNKRNHLKKVLEKIDWKQPLAEQIFTIFIHPEIRFGELEMYQQNKEHWIGKFERSINNKEFVFSLLGFPFKVPIVLKTRRVAPDLGEVMALNKLENLARIVAEVSGTSVKINIVTEGAFARFVGVSNKIAKQYELAVRVMAKKLGFNHLKFIPLSKMEVYNKDFSKVFTKKVAELTQRYHQKDAGIINKIEGAYSVILRIVNPKTYDIDFLMDLYNFKLPKSKISTLLEKKRQWLQDFTLQSTLEYFSYLELRDDLHFLEKEFGQNYLPLTVSPKPNRLGIIPINPKVKLLPHHGVPVYDDSKKEFQIQYLIDLLRSNKKLTEVYLKNDPDIAPFFYKVK